MWLRIQLTEFVSIYLAYVVVSFLVCLIIANTIAAWIFYFLLLAPAYLLCIAYVISIAVTKRHHTIRFHTLSVLPVLGFQGLMILTSPASCYGWKQGRACYSLLQSLYVGLFTKQNLQTMTPNVPRWSQIDSAFPIILGLYVLALILFLATLRFESNH